jgi:hypothetical protein
VEKILLPAKIPGAKKFSVFCRNYPQNVVDYTGYMFILWITIWQFLSTLWLEITHERSDQLILHNQYLCIKIYENVDNV